MVTYQGPLKGADNKHQPNKGDHQDVAIDDLIILKYRNLNLKNATVKRSASFYYDLSDATSAINHPTVGEVSPQPRQLPGFGHLHLYYIY